MSNNKNQNSTRRPSPATRGGTTLAIDSALKTKMEEVQKLYLLPHLSVAAQYCMLAGHAMFKDDKRTFELVIREHNNKTNKIN
ncbi:MAG: hypothetical protein M9949_06080 [Candidatus Kapabacteria bacterium]|nr:hypothetical protein [Candidatus Kapabacteria bacterium]